MTIDFLEICQNIENVAMLSYRGIQIILGNCEWVLNCACLLTIYFNGKTRNSWMMISRGIWFDYVEESEIIEQNVDSIKNNKTVNLHLIILIMVDWMGVFEVFFISWFYSFFDIVLC